MGHGIQAVVNQIDKDLLKLISIGLDRWKRFAHFSVELDISRCQCRLGCVEYLSQQRVDVYRLELRNRPSGRIKHRSNYVRYPFNLTCDDIEPHCDPFIPRPRAEQLDVTRNQVERSADLVSKLRGKLTGRGQSFELGQQPLHFKQTQVCIFKLPSPIGNLGGAGGMAPAGVLQGFGGGVGGIGGIGGIGGGIGGGMGQSSPPPGSGHLGAGGGGLQVGGGNLGQFGNLGGQFGIQGGYAQYLPRVPRPNARAIYGSGLTYEEYLDRLRGRASLPTEEKVTPANPGMRRNPGPLATKR